MKETKLAIFICTGNTCRSPLAEALAHYLQRKYDLPWDFFSAGIKIQAGVPINNSVIQVLSQMGIPYVGKPTVLTKDMVHKANVVFCMTKEQVETASAIFPEYSDKFKTLNSKRDIIDPLGMNYNVYETLTQNLLELIPKRLAQY